MKISSNNNKFTTKCIFLNTRQHYLWDKKSKSVQTIDVLRTCDSRITEVAPIAFGLDQWLRPEDPTTSFRMISHNLVFREWLCLGETPNFYICDKFWKQFSNLPWSCVTFWFVVFPKFTTNNLFFSSITR